MREVSGIFTETPEMIVAGLSVDLLRKAINYTHNILDEIDSKLLSVGADRLSQTVELANLSSMVGNLLGAGIATNSSNVFKRNGPHKFPDILSNHPNAKNIEIKISLEKNNPKGHLAKEGYYLTCRYVLVSKDNGYVMNERGDIVEIWEARFGYLRDEHFNISNTPGDSGKTAVINKDGMRQLSVVYKNLDCCPYSPKSKTYRALESNELF